MSMSIKPTKLKPIEFVSCNDESVARKWIELRKSEELEDKEQIVRYLESGKEFGAILRIEKDVLRGDQLIQYSPHFITDGTWIWILTVVYWLKEYNIALPGEFLSHVRKNKYSCPNSDEIDFSDLEYSWEEDSTFFWPDELKDMA